MASEARAATIGPCPGPEVTPEAQAPGTGGGAPASDRPAHPGPRPRCPALPTRPRSRAGGPGSQPTSGSPSSNNVPFTVALEDSASSGNSSCTCPECQVPAAQRVGAGCIPGAGGGSSPGPEEGGHPGQHRPPPSGPLRAVCTIPPGHPSGRASRVAAFPRHTGRSRRLPGLWAPLASWESEPIILETVRGPFTESHRPLGSLIFKLQPRGPFWCIKQGPC